MSEFFLVFLVCCCLCGCDFTEKPGPSSIASSDVELYEPYLDPNKIKFADHVDSNSSVDSDLLALEFTDQDGQLKSLKDFASGKNLILVMTRGYTGPICPYCSSQVSRLISNYDAITERNGQVVVIYPVKSSNDSATSIPFQQRVAAMAGGNQDSPLPFPILLDVELKSVDMLGLRKHLSKPATYIVDAKGRTQFAYVGNKMSDRPSVQAMIEQLDKIKQ